LIKLYLSKTPSDDIIYSKKIPKKKKINIMAIKLIVIKNCIDGIGRTSIQDNKI